MINQAPPLPIKNGVSPNCLWLPKGNWKTVLDFFLEQFPHIDKTECSNRFQREEMVLSDGQILTIHSKYQSGQHLYFYRELQHELTIPFEEKIIFEDEFIVVADKPHFLPVAPTGGYLHETLLVRLRNKLRVDNLELCHRLDRETAGLVLLTKQPEMRAEYHALFSNKSITKTYHALAPTSELNFPLLHRSKMVKGQPFFRMKEVKGIINAETEVSVLEKRNEISLYQLRPISGKKHQLRVHLAALGIPIVNDSFYPKLTDKIPGDYSRPLQLLAKSLEFTDPITHKLRAFESNLYL